MPLKLTPYDPDAEMKERANRAVMTLTDNFHSQPGPVFPPDDTDARLASARRRYRAKCSKGA